MSSCLCLGLGLGTWAGKGGLLKARLGNLLFSTWLWYWALTFPFWSFCLCLGLGLGTWTGKGGLLKARLGNQLFSTGTWYWALTFPFSINTTSSHNSIVGTLFVIIKVVMSDIT